MIVVAATDMLRRDRHVPDSRSEAGFRARHRVDLSPLPYQRMVGNAMLPDPLADCADAWSSLVVAQDGGTAIQRVV